jgi:hypothetical protein
VKRNDRLREWLELTYKTDVTILAQARGRFSQRTLTAWKSGEREPGAENLATLHELGLGVLWYLVGEGSMFSDSAKGRAFAHEFGERTTRAKQVDRAPTLIAEIEDVLKRFR